MHLAKKKEKVMCKNLLEHYKHETSSCFYPCSLKDIFQKLHWFQGILSLHFLHCDWQELEQSLHTKHNNSPTLLFMSSDYFLKHGAHAVHPLLFEWGQWQHILSGDVKWCSSEVLIGLKLHLSNTFTSITTWLQFLYILLPVSDGFFFFFFL